MAVARSPNYPQIDLAAALDLMKVAYKAEGRNKMSRSVLASHFDYSSLNGRALMKIGAVRAYGLIEGKEDELRITSDAIICLEAPEGSVDRAEAITKCALGPSVFREIAETYPTLPSEQNLRFHLIKKTFTAEAAGKAAQNYLSTMRLVAESGGNSSEPAFDDGYTQNEETLQEVERPQARVARSIQAVEGTRTAVFTLEEGDVTLTFPAELSEESYSELGAYLDIFLKRAQRGRASIIDKASTEQL